jgi:hypothetical protein
MLDIDGAHLFRCGTKARGVAGVATFMPKVLAGAC